MILCSYLHNLTGLNIMVSVKRLPNHTPKIKRREACKDQNSEACIYCGHSNEV